MYDDETPHDMFNRLKKLVNKARALGSYTPMNYNVVALIH
jgi:hypothetical protein